MKLFVLFITVFFLDFIIGSLLNIFYFKQHTGFQYRTTYSIEKTTGDLLIFGSSTASHDYYPGIFEKRLNMSYYNEGRDGTPNFYHYAVLKAVLKRYSPKIVIYDFDVNEFRKDQDSYDRLSSLLPYYKTHPEIRSVLDLKSPHEKLKLLSKIYPYNSSIFSIVAGIVGRRENIDINFKGYVPLTKVWNKPISESDTFINYELDSNKIKTYESFVKDCINSKVELYITYSPIFITQHFVDYSVILAREIADKYNVKFFDFSGDSTILSNPQLFTDMMHLNDDGAKVYSNRVVDSIVRYSKKVN